MHASIRKLFFFFFLNQIASFEVLFCMGRRSRIYPSLYALTVVRGLDWEKEMDILFVFIL